MPLVLTMNDVTLNHSWDDIEGVKYHFPNQYKNLVEEGEPFVYYRGVHRANGRRGLAEYFGMGRIGKITLDPASENESRPARYCAIEDYRPFAKPVPAKIDDKFFEIIPQNMWRNGARRLSQDAFDRIVALAEFDGTPSQNEQTWQVRDSLLIPQRQLPGGMKAKPIWRQSKLAKTVGDWAENLAMDYVRTNVIHSNLIHRAAISETPGWDIDYLDGSGVLQRIEVKGTVAGAFADFNITTNELNAAKEHGLNYWLYLVCRCLTDEPIIQIMQNPGEKLNSGQLVAKPLLFSIRSGSETK